MDKANHQIEKLDFQLPDFTRLSWVSTDAQEVWQPRITRIIDVWSKIEWHSVLAGVRSCCLTTVTPEDFVKLSGEWAKNGLSTIPLQVQGISQYSYSSTNLKPELGKPIAFRIVIGKLDNISKFQKAFDTSNEVEMGMLLGFPHCCLEFFQQVWVEQGLVDTTWSMAVNTKTKIEETKLLEVKGSPYANILWRWMGVRAVPHLPCNFDCQSTVKFGEKLVQVGRDLGHNTEMDWLLEILNWSAEWSALHGIAEIKTPIMKASTRTDATPYKYTVRRPGETAPDEGAKGLTFPYYTPRKPLLTETSAFHRGLTNPIQGQNQYPIWYATDNGFNSRFALDKSHQPIIDLALATLSEKGGNIIDFGCGNGALLKKIQTANDKVVPYGIDNEASRISHAQIILPKFKDNFFCGDMFTEQLIWPKDTFYSLAILMPGRLLEVEQSQVMAFKEKIQQYCDQILIYAYGDWLTRYGNLSGLAQEVGMESITSTTIEANASLAKINLC